MAVWGGGGQAELRRGVKSGGPHSIPSIQTRACNSHMARVKGEA